MHHQVIFGVKLTAAEVSALFPETEMCDHHYEDIGEYYVQEFDASNSTLEYFIIIDSYHGPKLYEGPKLFTPPSNADEARLLAFLDAKLGPSGNRKCGMYLAICDC
jgi:hypothetical protein